jgi:hypothetical protein
MYRIGAGSDIMGPGTSLVQRIDFNEREETEMRGLGCARRAGLSDCGCDAPGLGVFDSMDPTTWGWQEWAIVVGAGYMLISTVFTTSRVTSRVRALPGERRKKRAKALRDEAKRVSSQKGWF